MASFIPGSANLLDGVRLTEPHSTKRYLFLPRVNKVLCNFIFSNHPQSESTENSSKNTQKNVEPKENSEKSVEQTSKRVEEQSAEAIQSIIETTKPPETQTQQVAYNGKSDVIVFDGSLDKYILSNSCTIPAQVQQPQTPFVLNTAGNLLMVPSSIPTISTNITSTPTNQYYIINKPPVYNCYIPSSTILTEKDILAMPTVIVNDDRPAVTKKSRPQGNYNLQFWE